MGVAGAGTMTLARALATEVGWRLVESDDPRVLHVIAAAALGRREHVILTSSVLTDRDRAIVRGDLRTVRFVHLTNHLAEAHPSADALAIDATSPPESSVNTIRRECGL